MFGSDKKTYQPPSTILTPQLSYSFIHSFIHNYSHSYGKNISGFSVWL